MSSLFRRLKELEEELGKRFLICGNRKVDIVEGRMILHKRVEKNGRMDGIFSIAEYR